MSRISTVYVERQVADHPRTREVLARLGGIRVVECDRYGEVFNPKAQSFRLQKQAPALILAAKHAGHVLPAPGEYNIGGRQNYYFSHLLNCPYDCRYCFLQGMFRSANYVLFVDYENFQAAIDQRLTEAGAEDVFFFSGYDCDSLAFEGLSRFCAEFLPFFERRPRAWLELRTKSAGIGALKALTPIPNCVVAFSFTPETAHARWENGVPSIERRLEAVRQLAERGWKVGLRFDPLLWWPGCADEYRALFRRSLEGLDQDRLHSVSFGAFRLPAPFHRRLSDLYPEEDLLAAPLDRQGSMVSYRRDLERGLIEMCAEELEGLVGVQKLFPCPVSTAQMPPETPI